MTEVTNQAAFSMPVEDRPVPLKVRLLPIILLSAYLLINLLVVAPWGNFPLNDDWMYSHSVKTLMETGRLKLLGCCPSCALHIIFGALVCIPNGYSHLTLRFLNFFIAVCGVFALYGALLEMRIRRSVACLASFVYASTPLFANLSFTYMTDLSSLSLTTLYFYFMVRSINRRSLLSLIGASLMLMSAIAVRQTNTLYVLCNLVLLLLIRLRKGSVKTLLITLVIAPTIWAFFLDHLMKLMNEFPAAYDWYKIELWHMAENTIKHPFSGVSALFAHGGKVLGYLGLLICPLLVPFVPALFAQLKGTSKARFLAPLVAAFTTVVTILKLIWYEKRIMPFSENLMHIPALGAMSIIGTQFNHPGRRLRNWLTGVTLLWSFLLCTIIVVGLQHTADLARKYASRSKSATTIDYPARRLLIVAFAFLSMLVSLGWVVIHTMICDLDRYYLMPLVPMIVCMAIIWRWLRVKPMWFATVPMALLIATYSTCAEQDYMAWNTARWQALRDLEQSGVKSSEVDGGMEYNYNRDPALSGDLELGPGKFSYIHKGAFPRSNWRSWSLHGEDYIVSFTPLQDYTVISRYPYWSALKHGKREILVLKHTTRGYRPFIKI